MATATEEALPLEPSTPGSMCSCDHEGSEEGPGTLAFKLGPGVAQLHKDHPGLLLVGLSCGLRDKK